MKIKFLGAAGTVTGSSYVLTSGSGQSILIDLGMFQGPEEIEKLNYEPFEYDISQLKGVILTHAHLDHCGRLPIIMKSGFNGNIYLTPATADLVELTLMDSAKIAKEDKRKILYNQKDVSNTIKQFVKIDYRQEFHVGSFLVTFRDAGHILGSCSVEIVDKQPNSEISKIVFSGDLGNTPSLLEQETEMITSSDAVVMETTYGDRLHTETNPEKALQTEINTIETNGGTLLIPTFSLDRAQELLHLFSHLKREGKIKKETPIILDSPMAEKATKIYVDYPKLFNPHIQNEYRIGQLFDFPGLEVTKNWKDSQSLHTRKEPIVIVAGSGMMMGGRIMGHAKFYLSNPTTRLMITGYQAEGTLGRELLEGQKEVVIDKEKIIIKGSIQNIQSMSSHADQSQLINWLKNIKGVKKLFLTHGDETSREAFSKKVFEDLNITDIIIPDLHQEFDF